MNDKVEPLIDDTNARRWAEEFCAQYDVSHRNGWVVSDPVSEMIGWFANAIETGKRHHPAQVASDKAAVGQATTPANGEIVWYKDQPQKTWNIEEIGKRVGVVIGLVAVAIAFVAACLFLAKLVLG